MNMEIRVGEARSEVEHGIYCDGKYQVHSNEVKRKVTDDSWQIEVGKVIGVGKI